MNYELAKELKDAGFLYQNNPYGYRMLYGAEGEVGVPTLSELIEACGEKFWQLERLGETGVGKVRWLAYQHRKWSEDIVAHEGSTPEEAVARLWLALNKKT